MSYGLKQEVTKVAGAHWYAWSVWVDAPKADLAKVARVRYQLHPTFQEPVRTITTPANGFRLNSSGWGEFNIHATLYMKTGEKTELNHWLEFYPRTLKGSKEPLTRKIFISSSAADIQWRDMLVKELRRKGIEILEPKSLVGIPWEEDMRLNIGNADCVIAIQSKVGSPWVEREIEAAGALRVPNIRVTVGNPKAKSAKASRRNPTLDEFVVNTKREVGKVAEGIAEKVLSIDPPPTGRPMI